MVFSSKAFFIFLPIVLLLYHSLRRREHKYRFLLAASWIFYGWCNAQYLWVILAITVVDYLVALRIQASENDRIRKRWLILSLVTNLGLLAGFKYSLFVAENVVGLGQLFGMPIRDPVFEILLPLGISFHTFQGIAYTVDVYRRKIPAVTSFVDFALFLSFFPQLVAGPIVRADQFLPQMKTPPKVTGAEVSEGLHWFVCGLFKKLFIADWLGEYVAAVYGSPHDYGSSAHVWATLAWTAQIYCDFSAYSEMAIGSALFFGFRLPLNFNFPYLATSIADFWRRWHITLSTWLRDYLYYPLGGSRDGLLMTCRNLLITFVLCGLWHGASWNWLAFGLFHGLLMCGQRIWTQTIGSRVAITPRVMSTHHAGRDGHYRQLRDNPLYRLLATAATLYLIVLGMVLVRMESWDGAWRILQSMVGLGESSGPTVPIWVPALIGVVVLGHLRAAWRESIGGLPPLPSPLRATVYVTAVALLVTLSPGMGKAFIYFRF